MRRFLVLTAAALMAVPAAAQARTRTYLTVGGGTVSATDGDGGSGIDLGLTVEEVNKALGFTLKGNSVFAGGGKHGAFGKAVIFKDIIGTPGSNFCFSIGGGFGFLSGIVKNRTYYYSGTKQVANYGISSGAGLVLEGRLDLFKNLTLTADYMDLNAYQVPGASQDSDYPKIDNLDGKGYVIGLQYYFETNENGEGFFNKVLG
ncbi:hypothetical protein, partial [Desulfurobacterium sp.]